MLYVIGRNRDKVMISEFGSLTLWLKNGTSNKEHEVEIAAESDQGSSLVVQYKVLRYNQTGGKKSE